MQLTICWNSTNTATGTVLKEMIIDLQQVDRVEILILVDNLSDILLPESTYVFRSRLDREDKFASDVLLAEHGLSLLLTTWKDGLKKSMVMDAGYSSVAVPHNISVLGVDLSHVDTMLLSHGHIDHTGGIQSLLALMKKPVKLVMHPSATRFPRYITSNDGSRLCLPHTLDSVLLTQCGAKVTKLREPSLQLDSTVLVTGEIPRITAFEQSMPNSLMQQNGQLVQDPIDDDQALVVNVRGKGLVVVSGCAHAGIINTLLYAKHLVGQDRLHTVIGGFHLSGHLFEPQIEPTLQELHKLGPQLVVPIHCTGFKTQCLLAAQYGERFALGCVGSRIVVGNL